jgi:hypothetical protein
MSGILRKPLPSLRRRIFDILESSNLPIRYSTYNHFDYVIDWMGRSYQVRLTIIPNSSSQEHK